MAPDDLPAVECKAWRGLIMQHELPQYFWLVVLLAGIAGAGITAAIFYALSNK